MASKKEIRSALDNGAVSSAKKTAKKTAKKRAANGKGKSIRSIVSDFDTADQAVRLVVLNTKLESRFSESTRKRASNALEKVKKQMVERLGTFVNTKKDRGTFNKFLPEYDYLTDSLLPGFEIDFYTEYGGGGTGKQVPKYEIALYSRHFTVDLTGSIPAESFMHDLAAGKILGPLPYLNTESDLKVVRVELQYSDVKNPFYVKLDRGSPVKVRATDWWTWAAVAAVGEYLEADSGLQSNEARKKLNRAKSFRYLITTYSKHEIYDIIDDEHRPVVSYFFASKKKAVLFASALRLANDWMEGRGGLYAEARDVRASMDLKTPSKAAKAYGANDYVVPNRKRR
jgi:hypothetical protein